MAVLARHIQERGADDIGPLGAHDLDKARKRPVMAPMPKRLLAAFREPEIADRIVRRFGMPVHPHGENVAGRMHLAGAQRAKRGACLAAQVVLPTFAARRTEPASATMLL